MFIGRKWNNTRTRTELKNGTRTQREINGRREPIGQKKHSKIKGAEVRKERYYCVIEFS